MVYHRDEMPEEEFTGRLLFALAQPIATLGVYLGVPLKQVERVLRMAYFRASKTSGTSNQEVADALGVSLPTIARLARTTRENFLTPEMEHQLPQRIEFMLWAQPMSAAKMDQILVSYDLEDIEAALQLMMEEERIEFSEGRYKLARPQGRLVKSHWIARIGALNSLLDNLSKTVTQRFLKEDGTDDGFARTLNLVVAPEDVSKLNDLYELVIWPALVSLEQRSADVDDPVEVKMSLFWAVGNPMQTEEE